MFLSQTKPPKFRGQKIGGFNGWSGLWVLPTNRAASKEDETLLTRFRFLSNRSPQRPGELGFSLSLQNGLNSMGG